MHSPRPSDSGYTISESAHFPAAFPGHASESKPGLLQFERGQAILIHERTLFEPWNLMRIAGNTKNAVWKRERIPARRECRTTAAGWRAETALPTGSLLERPGGFDQGRADSGFAAAVAGVFDHDES